MNLYAVKNALPILARKALGMFFYNTTFTVKDFIEEDESRESWKVDIPIGTLRAHLIDDGNVQFKVIGHDGHLKYSNTVELNLPSPEMSIKGIYQWVMSNREKLPFKDGFPDEWKGPDMDHNGECVVGFYEYSPVIWMQISIDDYSNSVEIYWGDDSKEIEQHFTIGHMEFKPLIDLD